MPFPVGPGFEPLGVGLGVFVEVCEPPPPPQANIAVRMVRARNEVNNLTIVERVVLVLRIAICMDLNIPE